MADPRTARHLADRAIRSAVEDIEYGDVGDLAEDLFDELGEAAYDALTRKAHDLTRVAVVTVAFPGDPAAIIQAQLLRAFADKIDQGPDVPLPPSIFSALARETADDLDAQADHG